MFPSIPVMYSTGHKLCDLLRFRMNSEGNRNCCFQAGLLCLVLLHLRVSGCGKVKLSTVAGYFLITSDVILIIHTTVALHSQPFRPGLDRTLLRKTLGFLLPARRSAHFTGYLSTLIHTIKVTYNHRLLHARNQPCTVFFISERDRESSFGTLPYGLGKKSWKQLRASAWTDSLRDSQFMQAFHISGSYLRRC